MQGKTIVYNDGDRVVRLATVHTYTPSKWKLREADAFHRLQSGQFYPELDERLAAALLGGYSTIEERSWGIRVTGQFARSFRSAAGRLESFSGTEQGRVLSTLSPSPIGGLRDTMRRVPLDVGLFINAVPAGAGYDDAGRMKLLYIKSSSRKLGQTGVNRFFGVAAECLNILGMDADPWLVDLSGKRVYTMADLALQPLPPILELIGWRRPAANDDVLPGAMP